MCNLYLIIAIYIYAVFVLIEVLISLQIKQGPGVRMHMYDVATYIQYSEPYTHINTIHGYNAQC